MLGLMPGSTPKGIKSQAPCGHMCSCSVQHWGLGVQQCWQKCFGGAEQSLNFCSPPGSPQTPGHAARWKVAGARFGAALAAAERVWDLGRAGQHQMEQRGPGEAEGAGRALGGLWRPADPGEVRESRGEVR